MDRDARIYVAGHSGLVGSAVTRALRGAGFDNIVTAGREELDLTDSVATHAFFADRRPDYVVVAAARVGGIAANNAYPVEFLYDNLMIQNNVIHAAASSDVTKLLFLGSTCIYPKLAPQPMREDSLLTGPLEPTNQWYAIAKIAGVKLCEAYHREYGKRFISAMPTNLYGPGDNFDLESSHVMAALIRKFYEATTRGDSEVVVWGSGAPLREFLHVDDLASACLFLLREYEQPELINVGCGSEISIRDLAELIKDVSGFAGDIVWDDSRPDGTPRKLVDVTKLEALGWSSSIPLRDGLEATYAWYVEHAADARG